MYDGISWNRYELNNHSEVRGVKISDNGSCIYVGGDNEYGYFDVKSSGELRYHCLSDMVDWKYRYLGGIWDFYEYNGNLYMRGDNCILIKQGNIYRLVVSVKNIYASAMLDGIIYLGTDQGLEVLMGTELHKVEGCELITGKRINSMLPFRNGILIGTATNGLYYYDGKRVVKYSTAADNVLNEGVICCLALRFNQLAVGTIHKGLVLLDLEKEVYSCYDERLGMQSNTIQSVAFDNLGNIWCGLDNGIDYIQLNYPFTYLYRSPNSYGIGYSALLYNKYLYLGTDRGMYWTTWPVTFVKGEAQLHHVNGVPSSPAWTIYQNDDDIFCLHDKGIYQLQGSVARRITNILGAWSGQTVIGHKDMAYIGTYAGVYLLRKKNGKWESLGRIRGLNKSGRYMEQKDSRTLLIYYPNIDELTTFHLDASLTKVISSKVSKVKYNKKDYVNGYQPFERWDITGLSCKVSDMKTIMPYTKGYLLLDRSKHNVPPKVSICKMYVSYPKDSLVCMSNFMGIKSKPKISYSNNSVRFEYSVSRYAAISSIHYQCRLNNGSWSSLGNSTTKEYSSLSKGHYKFEVRSVSIDGKTSTDSIEFEILPPWYLTRWAYLVYFVLVFFMIWYIYKQENKRIKKKEQAAVLVKTKEVDQMKVEISQLEKDKMDLDLKHKSQEIANLVINVARKNEILTEIKNDIKRVSTRMGIDTTSEVKRQLTTVMSKISSNMEGDEVLKHFEEDFDLVNNNFISKLRCNHPNLTNNELMMCAYLKMNLSTKEMAPLFNMSVRGVETLRYRLRKKLGLEREDKLIDYLSNIDR